MNLIGCPYCGYSKNEVYSSTNQTYSAYCGKCQKKFKYKLIIKKDDDQQ